MINFSILLYEGEILSLIGEEYEVSINIGQI